MSSNRRRSRVVRVLRWIGAVAVVLVIVAAVVAFRARLRWSEIIEREIAAIEATGAPVWPEDLVTEPSSGAPWWSAIDADAAPIFDLGLMDPATVKVLLERPDAEFAPFDRPLLEALDALYVEVAAEGGSSDDVWYLGDGSLWPSGLDDAPWSDRRVLIARIEAAGDRSVVDVARAACGGSTFDARAWIEGWLAGDEPIPAPDRAMVVVRAQKALARRAWLAALDGDEETAVECVRLGFCVARAYERTPGHFHGIVWMLQSSYAIGSLVVVTNILPAVDLQDFEEDLAALDPRERMVRLLVEQRAICHRVFTTDFVDFDDAGSWLSPMQSLVWRLYERYDHVLYLETYAQLLDAVVGPAVDARGALEQIDAELWGETYALRTQLLMPPATDIWTSAMGVEVTVTLARAVLLARREGPDAARAWIAAQEDPFSGAPYRVATADDGSLKAWSVGADGVDDGGVGKGAEGRHVAAGEDIVVVLARD